jgi:hypothetical protein
LGLFFAAHNDLELMLKVVDLLKQRRAFGLVRARFRHIGKLGVEVNNFVLHSLAISHELSESMLEASQPIHGRW